MTIPTHRHQAHAQMKVLRHKEFLGGMVVVILLGCIFGYFAGLFFAQFLASDPNQPGFPVNTWEAMRETFFAVMSVFGILIWPTIFLGFYFAWKRRSDAKFAAKDAKYDEEARDARIAATELKIAEAKKRGEL